MNIKNPFVRPVVSGLISILLLIVSGSAWADAPRWFVAPVLDKAPDIELGLADPAWEKALKIPFAKLEDAPGDTSKYPTESYWLRAGGSLFVAFKCTNPSSPKLWATDNQLRDSNVYTKECIELFVGDFAGDLYYQLVVDACGNLFDGQRANAAWNGDWKRKVDRQAGCWTVIYEIPAPILSTIWEPGSFITINVTRHGSNPDGSGGEITSLSPPGAHSPKERVFLGRSNPALLGTNLAQAVKALKANFAKAQLPKSATEKLAAMDAFVAACAGAGDVPLERYQELFAQYVQFEKGLKGLEQDIVLNVIFEGQGNAR
ncbi:MAG: hypothetical protein WCS31_12560 [Verrucomicrobiae bacterium]